MLQALEELLKVFCEEGRGLRPTTKIDIEIDVFGANDGCQSHSFWCWKNWLKQRLDIISDELKLATHNNYDCTIKVRTKDHPVIWQVMVRNGKFHLDGQGIEFEHCNYALS